MSQHASHNSRNTSHTFQENEPREPLSFRHFEFGKVLFAQPGMPISRYKVHSPSHETDSSERHPIGPVFGVPMGDSDLVHLVIGVSEQSAYLHGLLGSRDRKNLHWVRPRGIYLLDMRCLWRREIFLSLVRRGRDDSLSMCLLLDLIGRQWGISQPRCGGNICIAPDSKTEVWLGKCGNPNGRRCRKRIHHIDKYANCSKETLRSPDA